MLLLDYCSISGKPVKAYDGLKKYIATGDVENNKIVNNELVSYISKPSRANVEASDGEVLFAKMKDTNKVLICDNTNRSNIYSTGFCVLKPKENVRSRYLYYYLNSNSFIRQKDKNCSGATQKAINNEALRKILIKTVPTLKEQDIIVSELDVIEKSIWLKRKQLTALNLLVKSQFVKMKGVMLCI